jgi:hypothetical protein
MSSDLRVWKVEIRGFRSEGLDQRVCFQVLSLEGSDQIRGFRYLEFVDLSELRVDIGLLLHRLRQVRPRVTHPILHLCFNENMFMQI